MSKKSYEAIYPLSPAQQGMLFESLVAPGSGIHVEQITCALRGALNLNAFERAWQRVVERHPVLRTAFVWKEQDEPLQVVLEQLRVSFDKHDLSGLGEIEQQERLDAYRQSERLRGFEFAKPPLMRLALFQTDEHTQQLVWTYHHILMDGWCRPIIFSELLAFYQAFTKGEELELPRGRSYKDYIGWLKQQDLAQAETFWRSALKGFHRPTPLGKSLDGPGPIKRADRYDGQTISLSTEETQALNVLARGHQLTLNTLVQGCWALLLSRYSNEEDVVFGVTVSGRPPDVDDFESTVGMFINTLPVRVHVPPDASVWPWLKELQTHNFALRQYEYTPTGQVRQWSEVPGALPLYESLLVFENYPVDALQSQSELSIDIANVNTTGAQTKFGVTILVITGLKLTLLLISDQLRLTADDAGRILKHLEMLLKSIIAVPDQQLKTLIASVPGDEIPHINPLRERERRRINETFVPPQTPVEEILANLWSQTLSLQEVGIHDNFFELGGHSLLATQLIALVRNAFQLELPLRILFDAPTVAELAVEIQRRKGHEVETVESVETLPQIKSDPEHLYEPFPLTDVQQAYWVGRSASFELGNVSTHNYLEIEYEGIDLARFEFALQRLIARHPMLRAIVRPDGQQQILAEVPPYRIDTRDLRQWEETEKALALEATRAQMSHQVLPADEWPLFQVRAARLTETRVRLHLSYDMLIGDALSFDELLRRELLIYYQQPAAELPELGVTFRDYVVAETAWREGENYQRAQDYWWKRIEELPPMPELPLAQDPAALSSPRFSRRLHGLRVEQWEWMKKRAARAGVTPSVLLLAAYAEVLSRWSKQQRFTINLTLFNRLPVHEQINEVVGDFTSLTLLAVEMNGAQSFVERARRLQQQLWEDMDHRAVSGVAVLREMARRARGARTTMPVVFTSVLGLINPRAATVQAEKDVAQSEVAKEETSAQPGAVNVFSIGQTPQVWLDLQVFELPNGGLVSAWDSVEELFPAGMMEQMFAAYCSLLTLLVEDEQTWERDHLPLMPAADQELQARANATTAPLPSGLLHSGFLAQAALHPEHPALLTARRNLSYGELQELSSRLAHRVSRLGVQPNQLVAVVMVKGWEQVVATLAILQAGAAYLPINAELPSERIEQLLADGEVKVVLTQSWVGGQVHWPAEITRLAVDTEELAAEATGPIAIETSAADLAYVIYTSGSTGKPKGVMIEHQAALNTIVDLNERFGLGASDRVFALSSLSFDLSVYDIFGTLAAGASIVLPEAQNRLDVGAWLEQLEATQVTVWNSVPALLQMLVEYVEGAELEPQLGLRVVWLSGDWIPLGLPGKVKELAPGAQVVSMGGATEAAIWSILYEIGEVDESWSSIPYGHAMRNQRMYVLNERLEECPQQVVGYIHIGGAGLARGYWRDEEKTARSFIRHPVSGERLYRTGDLGRWLENGEIEFLGREDQQVKVGGHRVELGEVEAALGQAAGVSAAVVVAVGERMAHKRLVAYLVPDQEYIAHLAEPNSNGSGDVASNGDGRPAPEKPLGLAERLEFKLKHHGLRSEVNQTSIQLVRPELDESLIESYYVQRRSYRKMLTTPIPFAQLSEFLSCLAQFEVGDSLFPKYRYGSAGSLYPVQTYLYIKPRRVEGIGAGTYYYHPAEHQLVLLTPDSQIDQSIHSAVNRALFNESAFSIFLIGQLSAITPMYGELSRHYAAIEAGLMTQLLEMSAPACELGLCQIGSLGFDRISQFFNLEESHVLLHSLVGGKIDPAQGKLPALLEELNEYRAVSELLAKQVTKDDPNGLPMTSVTDGVGQKRTQLNNQFISEVKSSLRGRLPDYMIPSSYVLLNTLPLTSNGKVDRKALPPPDEIQTEQQPETYIAPETEIEQVIAGVLQEVLKLEQVSVQRNFFDMGGTSVHMIQVYNKVRALLQREFPVVAIFEHPTVRALAKYLGDEAGMARPLLKQGVDRGVQRKEAARQRERQRKSKEASPVPPRN